MNADRVENQREALRDCAEYYIILRPSIRRTIAD